MTIARRSLRSQLVAELVLVASAAVVLVGVITALVAGANLSALVLPLVSFWAGSTLVLLVFGLHLLRRQVLKPLDALAEEADRLAVGGTRDEGRETSAQRTAHSAHPAAIEFETQEFATLAERFRAMAEGLLSAQGQVVRSEKLAGIGRLAAGVAHEVRNPLGAIANWIEVLRQRGTDPAVLEQMRDAVDRIDRIVASMLEYARPAKATVQSDLSSVVRRASGFLETQGALREVHVELDLALDAPPVLGDAHALEQVVINLMLNARDSAARRIVVSVAPHEMEAGRRLPARQDDGDGVRRIRAVEPRPVQPGFGAQGALLVVADDGPGVDEEDRERVFDPFYTTREPGKGTGLGLAIVARTVHDAGGMVWVDRAREGGAAFKVFLPSRDMEWERCAS
ncbi:MAG TPA: ATP-binding protein [Gemmatimonadales bacterium]|nr:ATP-binding protein [Gemmatimonadales bacterium]